ncbi:MAG: hypothetical protein HC813_00355 [Planctomycetes bacterium]|nr:hypothetical protein [Planctomycetota bacterium]
MRSAMRTPFLLLPLLLIVGGQLAAAPPGNPRQADARIELGRRLFLDPAVSQAGRFSCASCHLPDHGFSDPRRVSEDENGETRRHSQPVTDLLDGKGMHWDGEFLHVRELLTARIATAEVTMAQTGRLLQQQISSSMARGQDVDRERFTKRMAALTPPYYGPPTPTTPGTPPTVTVAERLTEQDLYGPGFRMAFGDSRVTNERIIDAMETFLLSLESGPSPYDRFAAGEPEAMNEGARRGLALFAGKANCASCHSLESRSGVRGSAPLHGRRIPQHGRHLPPCVHRHRADDRGGWRVRRAEFREERAGPVQDPQPAQCLAPSALHARRLPRDAGRGGALLRPGRHAECPSGCGHPPPAAQGRRGAGSCRLPRCPHE